MQVIALTDTELYPAKVHDWNKILPGNVHLYGAYKGRKPKPNEEQMAVPQQFTFIRRQGSCHAL